MANELVFESVLTCPYCGSARCETMPDDTCLYFYECPSCRKLLRPRPGDCCVFCSFGSIPCPPRQQQRNQDPCGDCGTDVS
ncbi:GDCCVxC domain-containing (seleno)protein [Burkholderia sp. A9]|uniref:GDCCVxC domain-containing (seleno)protein n=1 Tax=Burkholderia sp. A9 TaxID=1365108 RepID=UPI0009E0A59F|nr:GDCCVxC domain-containing (seleno)protein [Burkholderia sp. A9]